MRTNNSRDKRRKSRRRRKSSNKLGIIGITGVVVVLSVALTVGIVDANKKLNELTKQEEKLQQELEGQQKRYKELEERRVYVQTKKYIEETAKKFGLVYPDEIIFKPKED